MDLLADREFRNEPGKVRRRLAEEGGLVLTNRGKPYALMIPVESGSMEEAMLLASRLKAQMAVSRMRRHAADKGLDKLGAGEIDQEVAAVRRSRRS